VFEPPGTGTEPLELRVHRNTMKLRFESTSSNSAAIGLGAVGTPEVYSTR